MIRVRGLTKVYNKIKVINNLSYEFKSKGMYVIGGKSGSGKTTLLNILAGEDKKYLGEVAIEENLLYFKDKNNLVNGLKVKEIIEIFKRANNKQIKNIFYIDKLMNKKYKKLSLGEKQLITLTLVFNSKCNIIILDEPMSALSMDKQKLACSYLAKIALNKLVIISSHNDLYFKKYTYLDLENLDKEKVNHFNSYNKQEYQKINLFYYLLYFKKTIGRKVVFILSLLFIIISFFNIINYSNELFNNNLLSGFDNEGVIISRHPSTNKIDDLIFYEIIKKLSPFVIGYNANYYDSNLYSIDLEINNYYIDNAFTLSSFEYIEEKMEEKEIILGINYKNFCINNKLFNCEESYLKTLLINKKIEGFDFLIYDLKNTDRTMFFINERLYKVSDDYEYVEYYFDVDKRDISKIFSLINEDDFLVNFDYIRKGESENIVRYKVKSSDSKKFSERIDYSKYVVCLEKGYNCLNYLDHFTTLIGIDEVRDIDSLNLQVEEEPLENNEIIISSSLSKKLNKLEEDYITLYFNYNEEIKSVRVKIKRIIDNENDLLYQNSSWSYYLFKDLLLFDEEDLQIENIIVFEKIKSNDYISDNEYNEMLNSIKKTFTNMQKIINIINCSVTTTSIVILIVIELFNNKFKKEYFAYLHTLKISNKKHFIKK